MIDLGIFLVFLQRERKRGQTFFSLAQEAKRGVHYKKVWVFTSFVVWYDDTKYSSQHSILHNRASKHMGIDSGNEGKKEMLNIQICFFAIKGLFPTHSSSSSRAKKKVREAKQEQVFFQKMSYILLNDLSKNSTYTEARSSLTACSKEGGYSQQKFF